MKFLHQKEKITQLYHTVEDVNTFGMVWFMEFIATESHHDFMNAFPGMTDIEMDHDEFHEIKWICKRIMDENNPTTFQGTPRTRRRLST